MRFLLAAVVSASIVTAAHAETRPQPPRKPQATMHYPTLEKMLRRFSRTAGEPRTRG